MSYTNQIQEKKPMEKKTLITIIIVSVICALFIGLLAYLIYDMKTEKRYNYHDYSKYITLGDYSNLSVDMNKLAYNEIQTKTEQVPAKAGDNVKMTITSAYKTKTQEGSTETVKDDSASVLTSLSGKTIIEVSSLGSGTYCQAVEDAIIDAEIKANSSADVKVTLPADFSVTALQNTEVILTVKFNNFVGQTVQKGDVVYAEYTGYYTVDGLGTEIDAEQSSFNSGTTKFYIGSGLAIEDFENGMKDMQTGVEKEIQATFPEDYGNDELNGKKVIFKVTVYEVMDVPTIDNDWVIENYSTEGLSTMLDFKNYLIDTYVGQTDFQTVYNDSVMIKYPSKEYKLVKYDTDNYVQYFYENDTSSAYASLKSYISADNYFYYSTGYTAEGYAKMTVQKELVYYAIAKKENIVPTQEQIDAKRAELFETNKASYMEQGKTATEAESATNEYLNENAYMVKEQAMFDAVLDYLALHTSDAQGWSFSEIEESVS